MTIFGVVLRGAMPGIADAETGLSVFFQKNLGPVLTGIIVADVFATIAATANALLVAMAQAITHDITPCLLGGRLIPNNLAIATFVIGLITMLISMFIHGTVVTVALSSVSLLAAGIGAAVMIKITLT